MNLMRFWRSKTSELQLSIFSCMSSQILPRLWENKDTGLHFRIIINLNQVFLRDK